MAILDRFNLAGKTAVITGGARGIGLSVAPGLFEAGANLVLADVHAKNLELGRGELAERGAQVLAVVTDVTQPDSVQNLFVQAQSTFGRIHVVFNNAGICNLEAAENVPYESWLQVMNVNLNGVFLVARQAGRIMIAQGQGGSIINTASMSASIVNEPQKQASYNASKAAVVHLTKSLAVEWAPHKIRVNCISPGYMGTELNYRLDQALLDYWISRTPQKRMGDPEELQGAVLYFASDASTFTTGSNLVIDGAFSCI